MRDDEEPEEPQRKDKHQKKAGREQNFSEKQSEASFEPVNIDENQQVLQIHSDSHSLENSEHQRSINLNYGLNSNVAISEISKN